MTINADFVKTILRTTQKRFLEVSDKAKNKVFAAWKQCGRSVNVLHGRLIVRGEYTRRDLMVLFAAAVMLGIALKAVATDTVTIGFEDYTLAPAETLYDLNAMQKTLIQRGGVSVSDGVSAGACSE